jgi:hypothetical protein
MTANHRPSPCASSLPTRKPPTHPSLQPLFIILSPFCPSSFPLVCPQDHLIIAFLALDTQRTTGLLELLDRSCSCITATHSPTDGRYHHFATTHRSLLSGKDPFFVFCILLSIFCRTEVTAARLLPATIAFGS